MLRSYQGSGRTPFARCRSRLYFCRLLEVSPVRLVCTQRALSGGLAIVARAVPRKGRLPGLSNAVAATEGGKLKLVANNLEMAISAWIGADVADEGTITLP